MLLLPSICHVVSKGDGSVCREEASYNQDLMEGGCENIALPLAPKPAILSDLTNLDCTGLKLDNLREYLTERDV